MACAPQTTKKGPYRRSGYGPRRIGCRAPVRSPAPAGSVGRLLLQGMGVAGELEVLGLEDQRDHHAQHQGPESGADAQDLDAGGGDQEGEQRPHLVFLAGEGRSEERRVGKEWRTWRAEV